MKTFTFLFIFLFMITFGYSQKLPLDFEVAEDDAFEAFNGTVATVTSDPEDPNNNVLEMAGSGAKFDGASISLSTFVDLSNDANNTITFRVWSPVAATRDHLLKLEGGSSGPTELGFQTTMMGWQTVSVNFGSGLGTEYPKLTLFTDFNNSATGTFYFDDIDGPNGSTVPTPIADITTPAPDPTEANADVLSIFNDDYTITWTPDYSFGATDDIVDISGNSTIKMDFSAQGYGQGKNNVFDISQYDRVHFDYYVDDRIQPGSKGEQILFILIDNNGGVTEYNYELTLDGTKDGTLEVGKWVSVDVPLSFFENKGFNKEFFFQYKLGTTSDLYSKIVYFDNIFFSSTNSLGIRDITQTKYTSYPNPVSNVFHISSADASIKSVEIFNALGKSVKQLEVNNTKADIEVSNLSAGIYFAKVSNNKGGLSTVKMIKK